MKVLFSGMYWRVAALMASCEAMPPITLERLCISPPPQRQNSETRSSSMGVVERLSSLVTSVTHCLSIETSLSTSESLCPGQRERPA